MVNRVMRYFANILLERKGRLYGYEENLDRKWKFFEQAEKGSKNTNVHHEFWHEKI